MVTETEEIQAKEFLKRAEIRTMKKDLRALREVDSLKERDKIVKIKTLEEQQQEQAKQLQIREVAEATEEKIEREEILQKNEGQERIAEKDLKDYATEEERQQIFLLESQRLGFEKQVDDIDLQKDPALKLGKNKLLLQKRDQQVKLDSVLEQEKTLEGEEKVIIEKEQATTVPAERKGLEQARWDLDKKVKEVERKRWEAERAIQDTDAKIAETDKFSEELVIEKNGLRDKVLGVDKSLREIYSVIMAREEERRRGQTQAQMAEKKELSDARTERKEQIQREQWSPASVKKSATDGGFLTGVPSPVRKRILETGIEEEGQRKKFLQDVDTWSDSNSPKIAQQENIIPPPPVPPKKINK